jgi:hypothetical protein
MNKLGSLILSLILFTLVGCNDEVEVTELEFSKRVNSANSAEAYRNTVHPILLKRCATCHGDSGVNLRHSSSDYKESHDIVVDGGKVDFSNPANSRLVDKIISQRHNCWNGNCEESGSEMLAGIKKWIAQRGESPTILNGAKTNSLKYKDAIKRNPETINGIIVMQAEDGELSGRMKKHTSSTASNYTYIAGDMPLGHPIEQTARAGVIPDTVLGKNVSCKQVTAADLEESINGLVQYSEVRRHAGQAGYRYYSQRVSYRIINPNHRTDYLNALKNSTAISGNWFLRDGAIEDGDYTGNMQVYNGDNIRILPEFVDHATYESTIKNVSSGSPNSNFFAPRFGEAGIDYFAPSTEDVRTKLPDYMKSYRVRAQVQNTFKNYFFDGAGPETSSSLNETPYVLLSKPTGIHKVFVHNNLPASQEFYDYYIDGLTSSNSLDVVACKDSGTLSDGICSNNKPIQRIDTYVQYYVDPANRAFNDFSWNYYVGENIVTKNFDINRGTTNLDLKSILLDASAVDKRVIMIDNYAETLLPVVRTNCVGCHGNGDGPQFAITNKTAAFDAINGFINYDNPANSRPAQRMDEGHNCGGSCSEIKQDIVNAISLWKSKNETDITEAESNNAGPELKSLSDAARSPGKVKYQFTVTEAGDYNVWMKVLTNATKKRFKINILDKNGKRIESCGQNQNCATVSGAYCRSYTTGEYSSWTWYTPSIGNQNNRIKWPLEKGSYTLEIFEKDLNAKIDLVAISKNPDFNPSRNLVDEGLISSANPRILKYDISKIINSPGAFEIEIIEKNGGDSYAFRNPNFVNNTKNIKVQNIKVTINDKYEFTDSAYTKINQVVGTEKTNLTYAPLIALSINGLGNDSFQFVFEDLKQTNASLTPTADDAPQVFEGRSCKKLTLFKNSVMPILNRFRLIRKDDDGYTDFSRDTNMSPGRGRDNGSNPQFYTCTTCHNEEHPYFKMTTFFNNAQVLCDQALTRVDFGSFEKSLLIRGLNGTFNHPKLHFVESVGTTGSGGSLNFRKNTSKVNGFDSSWAGFRFEKYTTGTGGIQNGQINLNAYTGTQRSYLQKFIGQYVKIGNVRINDPYSVRNGDTRLPGDTYDSESENLDKWTYDNNNNALNMTYTVNPESFVARQGDLNPANIVAGGVIKIKDDCLGRGFVDDNGVLMDSCKSAEADKTVINEFESIKTRYRNAIINWMREEAKAAGQY